MVSSFRALVDKGGPLGGGWIRENALKVYRPKLNRKKNRGWEKLFRRDATRPRGKLVGTMKE